MRYVSRCDDHAAPGAHGDAGRIELGAHAAGAVGGTGAACHSQVGVGQRRNLFDVLGVRVQVGIGGIETVHVRQQYQAVGADHLRHARREPVIVSVTDFLCRHRVVLVDHGDSSALQQREERIRSVQVTAAVFAVVQRQ